MHSTTSAITMSIMNIPAVYTLSREIDDISLKALYVVRCESKWIGNAVSLADARMAARLHFSLFGSMIVH